MPGRYESDGSLSLQREKERKKLSHQAIADRLGRTPSFVYLLISGRRKIALDDAVKLEKWLGIRASTWVRFRRPDAAKRGAAVV